MTLPIYPHITSYDSIQISRHYKTFEQTFERNRRSVYAIRPPFEKRKVLLYSHEWESPSQIPGWCQITGQRKPLSWAIICHSP